MSRPLSPRCPQCGYRVPNIKKHLVRCQDLADKRNSLWRPSPLRINK